MNHFALALREFLRPNDHRPPQQATRRYANAYLHDDDPDFPPLGVAVPGNLQFGGKRNYGYRTTRLILEALDYSRLEDGEAFTLNS